jgi:polysaccharide biosynthesis transport protein
VELAGYFAIARRWWLLVLVSIALAAAAGYAVASKLPKVYQAEVRVLVGPLNTDLTTQRASGQIANTYAQLVTSDRITGAVIRRLGLNMRSSDLQDAINAVPNDVTRLVSIKVENGDPDLAATLANAIAQELGVLGAVANRPEGTVLVIDSAEAPTVPSAPQVSLFVLLAAFAGLVVAIFGIVLIEYVRDSVTSEAELRELSGAPILGRLTTRLDRKRDFASALLSSKLGERYRAMTVRIERSIANRKFRTVLVTGVRADGSAGMIAAGLALAFADRGVSTGLVDGNVEQPVATHALGLELMPDVGTEIPGSRVPMSRLTLVNAERVPGQARNIELTVVPSRSGREPGKVQDLSMVLDRLRAVAEVVVITAPPIDRSPEALLWAPIVDAILMVVPLPGARRAEISSGIETMRNAGIQLAGTILTETASAGSRRLRLRRRESSPLKFEHRVEANVVAAGRTVARGAAARAPVARASVARARTSAKGNE